MNEVIAVKINNIQRTNSINPYRNNQDTKPDVKGSKGKQKDEVQISSEAKELLGAQNKANAGTSVEKVQELKSLVSSGNYHVESGKIAEKLMPYFK
jgi:negative regulator of flagellin synthesis FlgM